MARIARKSQKKNRSRPRKQPKKTRRVRRRVMKPKWGGGNKQEDAISENILNYLRETSIYKSANDKQKKLISSIIYTVYIQNLKENESVPDSNVSAADVILYETTDSGDPILNTGEVITQNGLMRGDNPTPILTWDQMAINIRKYIQGGKHATYVFTNIPTSSPSVSSNSSNSSVSSNTTSSFEAGSV